jgi:hypothetical protein
MDAVEHIISPEIQITQNTGQDGISKVSKRRRRHNLAGKPVQHKITKLQ